MSEPVKLSVIAPDATPVAQTGGDAWLAMIERAARDPQIDIAKMERLFQMHAEKQARDAKAMFLASLSRMQSELPAAVRAGTAHNGKRYARFEDVMEALRPVLSKHGFSITFRVDQDDKTLTVTGILGHAQGHTEQTSIRLPADTSGAKNAVQAWGSSASYGKRYVAMTLTGIATDDDDDGRSAASVARKSSAASKRDGTDARFNEIKAMFEAAPDIHELRRMSREFHDEINAMPERWAELLSAAYDTRAEELNVRG